MTKRPFVWSLAGLLLVAFLLFPSAARAEDQPKWNWPSKAGQWIGDQFRKGGRWIERTFHLDEPKPPPKKKTNKGEKLIDMLIPPTKERVGLVEVLHQKYPLSHYQLDYVPKQTRFWNIRDQLMDLLAACAHETNNSIWNVNVVGGRLVMWLLTNALSLDVVSELSNAVSEGLKRFAGMEGASLTEQGVFGVLFPLMVIVSGLWLGYKAMIQEDTDGATRGLVYMVVIILFSFSIFYYAKSLMQTANQASSELNKGVMAVTTNIMEPSPQDLTAEEAGAVATNNLWQIMIHKPYLLMQYGTTQVKEKRVDHLLRLSYRPYQESERTTLVKLEVNQGNLNMTAANNGYRFLLLVFLSLFNLAMGVIVIFFSLAIIGYQLYFLMILLLAPLVLTWAIVPAWQEIATRWIAEALHALLMKLAWGVLLAMFFSFSSALYDFAANKSYVEMMILQWALVIALFWKRKMIFQFVTAPADYLAVGRWKYTNHGESDLQKMIGRVLRYALGGTVFQYAVKKALLSGKSNER